MNSEQQEKEMIKEHNRKTLDDVEMMCLKVKDSWKIVTHIPNTNNRIIKETTEENISNISEIKTATCLNLSGNHLCELSSTLSEHLVNLIRLDLSNNLLENLPDTFHTLENLQVLNLNFNLLTQLPSVIGKLINLQTLMAHKNRLKEIPANLGRLRNLQKLDLSSNTLKELPFTCKRLNRLEELCLADNKFARIPDCVTNGMYALRIFDISQNSHAKLHAAPASTKLVSFSAENNDTCTSFPTWLLTSTLIYLENISLSGTIFHKFDLPDSLPISRVKKFSMKACRLSDSNVEKLIAGMTNLEELKIGNSASLVNGNVFWHLPIQSLKQPSSLKVIEARCTGIPMITETIGNFVNLSVIDISANAISWLPAAICSLRNLRSLIMNNNLLVSLPNDIGNIISLRELKICHNGLCQLPVSIKLLTQLQYLDLYDNCFSSMPEVTLEMENLLGVDLEQNDFSTDDLSIDRRVRYESMRKVLRDYWKGDLKPIDGQKPESPTAPDYEEKLLTGSSYTSSFSCNSLDDLIADGSLEDVANERWDSDDSADEFDPNECKEPQRRIYSPLKFYQPYSRVFCPAQSHKPRVRERVLQMLKSGTLHWPTSYEEGQFEDP